MNSRFHCVQYHTSALEKFRKLMFRWWNLLQQLYWTNLWVGFLDINWQFFSFALCNLMLSISDPFAFLHLFTSTVNCMRNPHMWREENGWISLESRKQLWIAQCSYLGSGNKGDFSVHNIFWKLSPLLSFKFLNLEKDGNCVDVFFRIIISWKWGSWNLKVRSNWRTFRYNKERWLQEFILL